MSNTQVTLNHFFSFSEKQVSSGRSKQVRSHVNMLQLKDNITKKVGTIHWPFVLREAMKTTDKLLEIKIADVMISAWKQKGILNRLADSQKHAPEEVVMIPLLKHTIKSVHKPHIEVLVNGEPVGKINFTVDLALTLEGITLKVKGGRIMEILTGSCIGKGTIKCEDVVILETKTKSFRLPGSIPLDAGTDIRE